MKVCTCFLLFELFAYTNSISQIRQKEDHRGVYHPQKTIPEYSYEEYSGDTNNLDDVHNLKIRGKKLSKNNMKHVFGAPKVDTLTDFIQEAVIILNTYEDTAFEDFFHVLDNEIRKYHYRGCKFSELMQNSNTRNLLVRSLKLIREKPVSFTKAKINEVADMMRDETYDKNVKALLDYINSLYKNTELNFYSVLNELKHYRHTKSVRTHNNLIQVIRGGVQAVLFNPYTELDINTRRKLKERIEIFWKQFKNNPASSGDMNNIPNTDPIIKSDINSFKVPENPMNKDKNPKPYSKNNPEIKLKRKRERIVSIKTYGQHEKDESSNESGKQITNYNTDEASSGQSFDSSSNSIKNSQERHKEFNTQRYMTLYTEEISYKLKTTKKTGINPISANVMTRRPKVKKRQTTTWKTDVSSDSKENIEMLRAHDTDETKLDISNTRNDTENGLTLESEHEPRVRENYDERRKQGKAEELRSKNKQKNMKIISQYEAVIDVQLANTELLKYLRMFEPAKLYMKYDNTLYSKSAIQTEPVPTKSTIRARAKRTQAEIRPQKPTANTKPPLRYSIRNGPSYRKQLSDLSKNIARPLPDKGHPFDQFLKDKNLNQKYLRRSDNYTIGAEDFNTYVIKRLNAMENKLNELKQMDHYVFRNRMDDNNTYGVEAGNVTENFQLKDKVDSKRKDMKGSVIETLLNESHDLNNEEVNDGLDVPIKNNTINTESSTNNNKSRKLNVIQKDAVNATVIYNRNTTPVTNNISKIYVNVTKKLNKGVINNNDTTSTVSLIKVTNATKLESVVTTLAVGIARRTMAYSEPYNYDFQFYDHINDSLKM